MQQQQREKVAADLSSRAETRQAKLAAKLERAAAEQARRDGIVAELKGFVDDLWMERSVVNVAKSGFKGTQILRINGRPAKPEFGHCCKKSALQLVTI